MENNNRGLGLNQEVRYAEENPKGLKKGGMKSKVSEILDGGTGSNRILNNINQSQNSSLGRIDSN